MRYSPLLPSSLAFLMLFGPVQAEVIDNTVITDFVDQTPGFDVARPLGATITGDDAVYLVGTMNFDVEELAGSFIEANMGFGTVFTAGFGNAYNLTTIVIAQNGTRASTSESFTVGVPVQLVMKFNQVTGDTTLWVNPNLATLEALNTPDAAVNIPVVMDSTFDSVIFRSGDFTPPASVVDYTNFAVYHNGDSPFASLSPSIRFVISPTEGSPGHYDFEWDSQEGELYDLVSATDLSTASSTWPVWDGREDLVATPPVNTLTDVPGGGDPRRFFVLIETDAPPLLAEDFESGTPAGWVFTDNGAGTAWSVGTPDKTGTEPASAANGTLCAGTNMNGNYTASASASLITPAFTVPAGGATLKFSQYIDTPTASGGGDFGSIRLLNAVDNIPLAGGDVAPDLQGASEQWSSESLPLPAAANGLEVKLEFRFESDADTNLFAGFYIDDVLVEGVAP